MDGAGKLPFDIDAVMDRVREAVRPLPKAVMFELADEGRGNGSGGPAFLREGPDTLGRC